MSVRPPSDSPQSGRKPAPNREAGDTLIEVLIAVVVIGLCVAAILGALTTTISSSAEHRALAADNTVITSFAEQVREVVDLKPSWPGTTAGNDCPAAGSLTQWYQGNIPVPQPFTPTGTTTYPVTLTDAPYAGYTVNISSAVEWNGSSSVPCQTTLTSAPTGTQLVTLQVTAPNGVSDTVQVIVRKQSNGGV